MTPQEEIKRAEEAKLVVENPMFKGAIQEVRQGIVNSLGNSPMGDEKTHNRLAIALQIVNQIERILEQHIQTGVLAQIQLEDQSKFARRVNQLFAR